MKTQEFLAKIKVLKNIKPRQEWVNSLRRQLFVEEPQPSFPSQVLETLKVATYFLLFRHRPAFITTLTIMIFSAVLALAQNSLPGDFLYPVKQLSEKTVLLVLPPKEKTKAELEIAQKRLEELEIVAKRNQAQKLAPAVKEYKEALSSVARKLAQDSAKVKERDLARTVVEKTGKILEKESQVAQTLATEIGVKDLANAAIPYYESLAKELLEDLKAVTLNDAQKAILEEAQQAIDQGDYQTALEKLLSLNSK
jgi:hypothetical protein